MARIKLDVYTATLTHDQAAKLSREGYDIAAKRGPGGVEVDLVLSGAEAALLRGEGLQLGLKRNRDGKTSRETRGRAGGERVQRLAFI